MKAHVMVVGLLSLVLIGCGIEQAIRKNEDRYAKPGAMDMAISSTPYYVKHSFKLLDRYVVKQEWLNGNGSIAFGGYFGKPKGLPLRIFDSLGEIYEEQGVTWYQADKSYAGINPKTGQYWRSDFDRYVRSVKYRQPIYAPATKEDIRASEDVWTYNRKNGIGKALSKKPVAPPPRNPIRYDEIETGLQPISLETNNRGQTTNNNRGQTTI